MGKFDGNLTKTGGNLNKTGGALAPSQPKFQAAALQKLENPTQYMPHLGTEAIPDWIEPTSYSAPIVDTPFANADSQANPNWAVDLNDRLARLAHSLGVDLADLDESEQNLNLSWENKLRLIEKGMADRLKGSAVRLADRGLSQSGIALNEETKVRNASNEELAQNQQVKQANLGNIARKRLQAEAEYNLNKMQAQGQVGR